MTRRADLTLAAHLAMWVTLAALVFLTLCRSCHIERHRKGVKP